jgi:hypothetical protein
MVGHYVRSGLQGGVEGDWTGQKSLERIPTIFLWSGSWGKGVLPCPSVKSGTWGLYIAQGHP